MLCMTGNKIEQNDSTKKCRICLKEGEIPIYGKDYSSDLSFDVRTFGDIDMSEDDEHPKYLCEQCHKLLQAAILFRNIAQKTDTCLRKMHFKYEFESDDFLKSDMFHNAYIEPHFKNNSSKSIFNYFTEISSNENSQKNKPTKYCRNSTINKVKCQVCCKIITRAYFKEHSALHDPAMEKYICDICGKSFRQRCAFITHRYIHSTDFKYKCKVCPYRGRTSGYLKTHIKIHTKDYKYLCSECPARFLTKSNFNRHSVKHKNPQFKCDICQKGFYFKLTLENHIKAIHHGIKDHLCDFCGKAFGYRKTLMQHKHDIHKRQKMSSGRAPAYLRVQYIEN